MKENCAFLQFMELKRFIQEALQEDVGPGDYSSLASISPTTKGEAKLLVKDEGVLAGVRIAQAIALETNLELELFFIDGDRIKKGDIVFIARGLTQNILKAERLLLNCLQRMSGIATTTRKYVDAVSGYNVKILDTRKTTPLMRELEKEAVVLGGGTNHRMGLYDMIMLKDNHVEASGGIRESLVRAKDYLKKNQLNLKIEIETRNLEEVKEALETGIADRIMLDNFTPAMIVEALDIIHRKVETEASGGITLDNIHEFAITGVDYISVGAITHSVKSLDLSLKII